MNVKKNLTLIIGVSIPLLMILFVAAAIYLPRFFVHPEYDFLYASGDYYGTQEYGVQKGKLVKQESKRPEGQSGPPGETKLFVHDVNSNQSREVSFEEARILELDSSIRSPDGFEIVGGDRAVGMFPFFSARGDDNSKFISGHNVSKELDLQLSGNSYYSGNFRFLGWMR